MNGLNAQGVCFVPTSYRSGFSNPARSGDNEGTCGRYYSAKFPIYHQPFN
ncbi:MAG: hypothetical protein K1X85_02435 [Ignavibacteria bacterium]|nr:hypothetical protein [Ignavibacteria bacterium]